MKVILNLLVFFCLNMHGQVSNREIVLVQDSTTIGYKYLKSDSTVCYSKYDSKQKREVFEYVDKMPMFGDKYSDLAKYIYENLKYPIISAEGNVIEDKVFLSVVVEPDGSLSQIQIMRGHIPEYIEDAIRVIKDMPKWEPGTCKGVKVPVIQIIFVNFRGQH